MKTQLTYRFVLWTVAILVLACQSDRVTSSPDDVGRPMLLAGADTTLVYDTFTGTDGTDVISHVAETGQSWTAGIGAIKIQNNTARLSTGVDNNNHRMAITTDVADDSFDLSTDYTRGAADVGGDYAQLEFLAQSGTNPPQDRVYIAFTRTAATTVQVRLIRTKAFSFAQSIILDNAFPLSTDSSKRIGVSVSGLQVQTWWEPAGGGTRTNIGSAVTLTQDYRDGTHKRVAFNFVGSQAVGPGSPRIDNFTVVGPRSGQTVPATAPDTIPGAIYADSNLVTNSTKVAAPFVRDVVDVLFATGSTQSQRQAAIDQIGGVVIGGSQFPDGDGYYLVRVPGNGTDSAVFASIDALRSLSYVQVAMVEMLLDDPTGYLRPNDGQSWRRADWAVTPDSARGVNWSLEATAAPLAWGCTTGDTTKMIAVVDNAFIDPVTDLQANVDRVERANAYVPLFPHGTAVTSALGAVGNNGSGITGMMWRARLRLYEVGQFTPQGTAILSQGGQPIITNRGVAHAVVRAALAGARVVNLSLYRPWRHGVPHTGADSAVITQILTPMIHALRVRMPPTGAPLLTVIAGNNGQFGPQLNAFWSAYPALADTFPRQVVVVGAHDITHAYAQFADTGRLVTVAAPGVDVTILGTGGNPVTQQGTSFAAPYVSGLAGLLLAFDSALTRDDLYRLIIDGARRGGDTAGVVPIMNAYESLKLAARRPGAPLCGNRVWVNNNSVIAERNDSTHTTQQLTTLSEAAAYVNVRHGGRRVEVSATSGDRAFELRLGQWVETQDTATTQYGATYLSLLQWSHDLDSAVGITPRPGSGFVDLDVKIRDFAANTNATIQTIHVLEPSSGTYVCLLEGCTPGADALSVITSSTSADWRFAYSPQGG